MVIVGKLWCTYIYGMWKLQELGVGVSLLFVVLGLQVWNLHWFGNFASKLYWRLNRFYAKKPMWAITPYECVYSRHLVTDGYDKCTLHAAYIWGHDGSIYKTISKVAEVATCPSYRGSVHPQHLKWCFRSCFFGAAKGGVAHRSSGGVCNQNVARCPVILRLWFLDLPQPEWWVRHLAGACKSQGSRSLV